MLFSMNERWVKRFRNLCFFGWLGLASLPFWVAAMYAKGFLLDVSVIAVLVLCVPGFLYLYVVILWHWKDRYQGKHSDLWGALILLETTGWMKLVYIFRHLIPDLRHTGRYGADASESL